MNDEKNIYEKFSMRERQIMDAIMRLKKADTQEVLDNIPNPPTYNAIRSILGIMVNKGYLKSYRLGKKLVYQPVPLQEKEKDSLLKKMVQNLFEGSAPKAISTILNFSSDQLSKQDIKALKDLIAEAEKRQDE